MENMTNRLTTVWKHEWIAVRNGCFAAKANILFSHIVQSTSSSCNTTSFFNIFTAYTSSVFLCSANITWKRMRDIISLRRIRIDFWGRIFGKMIRSNKKKELLQVIKFDRLLIQVAFLIEIFKHKINSLINYAIIMVHRKN